MPRDNFGGVGIIDMPSARFAPDGELSISASGFQNTQHYSIGFQALPWLETSFRYSGLTHYDTLYPVYYDRAFAVKARLWNESDLFPTVAIGINDLVGTGVYTGEYIVASKQFGNFDASLGLGWGRLSTADPIRNPLGLIVKSFDNRSATFGNGGSFNFSTYFHGPNAGIFGGIVWRTPIENLSLLAEYSSDKYVPETVNGNFKPKNQTNLGLSYQAFGDTTFGLNWLYGRSLGASISLQIDPTTRSQPEKIDLPPALPVHTRTDAEQVQAFNALLAQRNASSSQAEASMRNAFVDLIWRDAGNVQDVSISGHTVLMTVAAPSSRLCETIARNVAPYASDINLISLTGKPQDQPVRCNINGATPQSEIVWNGLGAAALAGKVIAPTSLVIDASGPPPANQAAAIAVIKRQAIAQQISIETMSLNKSEAVVYYNNASYFSEVDVIERLLRILMATAPPGVEKFRLIPVVSGVPQVEYDIMRSTAERSFAQEGNYSLIRDGGMPVGAPKTNPPLSAIEKITYPRFSWSLFPQFRQELFDPANPFGIQLLAGATGEAEILPGLTFQAEVEASIYDTFYTARSSDSALPHVRTDFLRYFTQGKNGIGLLDAEYRFRISPEIFAVVKAGYLESMFAGVGGEVLWRPSGERWALSADLYDVKQRDFNRLFGLQPYSQVTGHVSLYYESPWYGLNFEVRAGQYLAGDRGATLQVSRRFPSGIEVGVFATKTNVSAEQFGEGSFDKGILVYIPLGWVVPINTPTALDLVLKPIQRDGGQPLAGDAPLYQETRRTSEGEILRLGGN